MVGVVSAVARALGGARVEPVVSVPRGVAVVESAAVTWLAGRLAGMDGAAAAVTLGRTILVRPGVSPSERLLRHELAHVRQWERDVLFPFRYTAAHIRHGYGGNPYEAEARAAETGQTESGDGA